MRKVFSFCAIFLVSFLVQLFIWHHDDFTDQALWTRRLAEFIPAQLAPADLIEKRYSSTPGTPVLILGHAFFKSGFSTTESLRISVSLLVAFNCAWVAYMAKKLIPESPWWLAAGVVVVAHPLFLQASPVDAVVGPMLCSFGLGALYLALSRDRSALFFATPVIGGAALATRFHISALCIGLTLLLLFRTFRLKKTLLFIGITTAVATALNPFLQFIPRTYFDVSVAQQFGFFSGSSIMEQETVQRVLLMDDLLFFSFAILSIVVAFGYILAKNYITSLPIPHSHILAAIGITGIVSGLLFVSALQSIRYFFPIVLFWELLLPALLLPFARRIAISSLSPKNSVAVMSWVVVLLLSASNIFLLLYTLHLPEIIVHTV